MADDTSEARKGAEIIYPTVAAWVVHKERLDTIEMFSPSHSAPARKTKIGNLTPRGTPIPCEGPVASVSSAVTNALSSARDLCNLDIMPMRSAPRTGNPFMALYAYRNSEGEVVSSQWREIFYYPHTSGIMTGKTTPTVWASGIPNQIFAQARGMSRLDDYELYVSEDFLGWLPPLPKPRY